MRVNASIAYATVESSEALNRLAGGAPLESELLAPDSLVKLDFVLLRWEFIFLLRETRGPMSRQEKTPQRDDVLKQ